MTRNAGRIKSLDETALGERHDTRAGHDEMVQGADVDERQSLLERGGEQLVGARRLGYAAGVVVSKDHGSGICRQRRLHHLTRIHACLSESAAKELAGSDQPILAVEEQSQECLV